MGQSTDTYLLYGYDLGGADGDWAIKGAQDGEWEPDWMDPDDPESSVEAVLRKAAGWTETDWQAEGYFDRRNAVDRQIGVRLVSHCSSEYPMYVLAAHKVRASRGNPEVLDLAELAGMTADLNVKLASALHALGFEPEQERPAWILCSDWG